MTPIQPTHPSIAGVRIKPHKMDRAPGMERKQYEALVKIAISIFTDCTNVGVSFQDSLLAIYLSGLQHGASVTKENE